MYLVTGAAGFLGGTLNILEECKARRELGYRTRPYRETMHDEIQWMKSAGLIPA